MGKTLSSYYDFAENDYQYLIKSYEAGMVANAMGALAQGICEKYLKHIINEYVVPESLDENKEKADMLRTHNLNKLHKYISRNLPDAQIDKRPLNVVNGLYFTTRYPGEESIMVDKEDLCEYIDAVKECKADIDRYMSLCMKQEEEIVPVKRHTR